MKKYLLILLINLVAIFSIDVYACGEIKELKSNIGTVTSLDYSNYLITVPEGTKSVTLEGLTDYTWVEGFGPRTVSTDAKIELKVDGKACGYGIYTYFVKFKTLSNLIAENTVLDDATKNEENTSTENSTTGNSTNKLKLSSLSIEGYNLEFNPEKLQYTLDVEYDVTNLSIKALSENSTDIIQVSDNAYSLKEGLNVITITLTDSARNTQTYTINANRLKERSDNNYLANILVNNYQLNFDPSITSYQLSIGKESMLTISVITESELATYEILGNNDLEDGSVITIRVTAENGNTKDYIINITREFNIMDYWIYILIVLLLVLLLLLLLIAKQKKNQKKMGPEALATQNTTAGVIKEVAPQNAPQEPQAAPNTNSILSSPTDQASLRIIEPTNIEETEPAPVDNSADEDSPTEIFQL